MAAKRKRDEDVIGRFCILKSKPRNTPSPTSANKQSVHIDLSDIGLPDLESEACFVNLNVSQFARILSHLPKKRMFDVATITFTADRLYIQHDIPSAFLSIEMPRCAFSVYEVASPGSISFLVSVAELTEFLSAFSAKDKCLFVLWRHEHQTHVQVLKKEGQLIHRVLSEPTTGKWTKCLQLPRHRGVSLVVPRKIIEKLVALRRKLRRKIVAQLLFRIDQESASFQIVQTSPQTPASDPQQELKICLPMVRHQVIDLALERNGLAMDAQAIPFLDMVSFAMESVLIDVPACASDPFVFRQNLLGEMGQIRIVFNSNSNSVPTDTIEDH